MKSSSDQETHDIARKILTACIKGKIPVVCLFGQLGAGKTTFTRGFAKALGIEGRIQSPTFTYQRIYNNLSGGRALVHFDCYRLEKPDPIFLQDLQTALEQNEGIVVVEWADRIAEYLPEKRIELYFSLLPDFSREITIKKYDGSGS